MYLLIVQLCPVFVASFLLGPNIVFRSIFPDISVLKKAVFWDVVLCGLVEIGGHFRDAYCLSHQGEK
jgi:hypothetical protein